MSKKILKKIFFIIYIAAVLAIFTPLTAQKACASSKKSALKAYGNALMNGELTVSDDTTFSVEDINHDGTPELILFSTNSGLKRLYTYYKGEIKSIISYSSSCYTKYYKKGCVFAVYRYYGEGRDQEDVTHYKIIKGKIKQTAYYYDDISTGTITPTIKYEIKDKEVSKKKYEAYVKKLTKGSKEKKLEFHPIDDSNIEKYTGVSR